ncbi:MAG: M20 aminoacylase family protein [Pseudomonadota bacterium]
MPVLNSIADAAAEIAEWRRDFHIHPELQFEVHRTAGIVAAKLREWGCDEVVEGIGKTGVVGVIKGRNGGDGKVVGLRADMDALPIEEATGKPWSSQTPGVMHACGHDGHTAMLLGAARSLCESRAFDGTVLVIFQPAEEGGGGGREMVKDGMMERWGVNEVYGLHNMPGIPVGTFAIRKGPMMAAADHFEIEIEGLGGHAAKPHDCIDTTLVGAHIMTAVQSIVARNVDPVKNAVISVTTFHTDSTAHNVIPQTAEMKGTVRTLSTEVQDLIETRLPVLVSNIAAGFGAQAQLRYHRNYPVTANHDRETEIAIAAAKEIVGEANVEPDKPPVMGAEDFAFMLDARPGAYIMLGAGEGAGVHHPAYDFNDAIIPEGSSYWVKLAEKALAS